MKRYLLRQVLVLLAVAFSPSLRAQTTASGTPATSPPSREIVQVPAGESLEIELRDSLNTRTTRKGDLAEFRTADDIWSGGRVAIPRGSTVRATVAESKRPGRLHGRAEIRFEFKELVLPDGTSLALAADPTRAGDGPPGEQTVQGEPGKGHDVSTMARNAGMGAIWGGIVARSAGGAVSGGAAVTAVGMMLRRGPDLDLPPGMRFEIALTKPLNVSAPHAAGAGLAANSTPAQLPAQPASLDPRQKTAASLPGNSPAVSAPSLKTESGPAQSTTTLAANRTPPSPPPLAPPAVAGGVPGGFTLKVNVNLVLVDVTVRDARGRLLDGLMRNDFRVFEDGVEQQIQHFSRDELPLAVALVIDRSGSVAPAMGQIRDAALSTLSQLKTGDQVALFAFAARAERVEPLTTDCERIADAISRLRAGGGTNIADALDEAALYLGRAAPGRRHAIILISDNQGTVRGYANDGQVIRSALETETVIYSIRVGGMEQIPLALRVPLWSPSIGSVKKMTHETGGEIIDTREAGSIESAMAQVIRRLKMRYTLGYESTNQRRDGSFRKIEVQVIGPKSDRKYSVYARKGYYAPLDRTASSDKK